MMCVLWYIFNYFVTEIIKPFITHTHTPLLVIRIHILITKTQQTPPFNNLHTHHFQRNMQHDKYSCLGKQLGHF